MLEDLDLSAVGQKPVLANVWSVVARVGGSEEGSMRRDRAGTPVIRHFGGVSRQWSASGVRSPSSASSPGDDRKAACAVFVGEAGSHRRWRPARVSGSGVFAS